MTEIELYRLLAYPVVSVLAVLFLLKAPWRARLVTAFIVTVVGLAAGFLGIWATRAGAPVGIGWVVVGAAALFLSAILWVQRRRTKQRPPPSLRDVR